MVEVDTENSDAAAETPAPAPAADVENPDVATTEGGEVKETALDVVEAAPQEDDGKPAVTFMEEPQDLEVSKSQQRPTLTSSGLEDAPKDDLPFESHFTMRIPTSTLRYRGQLIHVVDTDDDQIILSQVEDEKGKKIFVKRISPESAGQKVLRIGYTLVTILFVSFLFVFAFQVLLFLMTALPVYSGIRTGARGEISGIAIVSTLLAFPLMIHAMSSLMAMGSAFVMDTWRGGTLFRSNIVQVLYMFVFLVAPFFTLMVCLFAKSQESWRITAGVWCILVTITFCAWALAVTYREVKACFYLVERLYYKPPEGAAAPKSKWKTTMTIAKIALLKSQMARYSGTRSERYHVAGTDTVDGDDDTGFSSSDDYDPVETKISLYSRLTALSCCSSSLKMFDKLDPPRRVWKPNEQLETPSIMTKNNWSMQRMWFGGASRQQKVTVANGDYALTPEQIKYSAFCTVLSSILVSLLVIGFLVWMEQGTGLYILVAILSIICIIYPLAKASYELKKMYQSVNHAKLGFSRRDVTGMQNGTTLFQVWETVRIAQPKEWYCYARVILEIVVLFLWPLVALLALGNYPIALVFFVFGFFSFVWEYFDATTVLLEYGTMSKLKDVDHDKKYIVSTISKDVIDNKGRQAWTWVFLIVFVASAFLFLSAENSSDEVKPQERGPRPPVLLVDDFYYPPQEDTLAYPTCRLTKGFTFSTDEDAAADEASSSLLGDYAFLSAMAYETANITKYSIDQWLGKSDVLVDEDEFVSQWREDSGTSLTPVYFKLFSIRQLPEYAIMSIRGSETSYDWMVNLQLWSSAGLAQTIKWLTPFGWIWDPILPDLLNVISYVQSNELKNVAYYKVTTRFVNDVLDGYGDKEIKKIYITGASLGGGLAVITGAQTEAYTVAISGLGAKLSRKMFEPPIELEALNNHTFNYIPDRDYIARIGGRQKFFQNAFCGERKNNLFGCHSMWRSVCEINYRCGTNGRPVVCKCVSKFGYPVPTRNGTRTFEEACEEAQADWDVTFG